jgi:hypothetical protein
MDLDRLPTWDLGGALGVFSCCRCQQAALRSFGVAKGLGNRRLGEGTSWATANQEVGPVVRGSSDSHGTNFDCHSVVDRFRMDHSPKLV